MTVPERIWAEQTDTADQNWRTHDRFGGIEYHRADLTETRIAAAVKAALGEAAALAQRVAKGYSDGGDEAIGCGVYLTAGNILALADDPASIARIVKDARNG
jgi:hypothetical protein